MRRFGQLLFRKLDIVAVDVVVDVCALAEGNVVDELLVYTIGGAGV